MDTGALSALLGWIGGLVSWGVAASFDYRARESALSKRAAVLEVETRYDKDKAKDYGLDPNDKLKERADKIMEAAANEIGGNPSVGNSLQETYTQPLLVGALTGAASVFLTPQNRQMGVPMLLWVAVIAGTFTIALLDGKDFGVAKVLRHWTFIVGAWLVVLIFFVGVAWAASRTENGATQQPVYHSVPAGPDGG
jgi:lipopolysaccharide export LptBFGC system permease protein LptF